ncbi:hypothetical protein LTR33_004633, partial [Friedmanniomyces endolithicus]
GWRCICCFGLRTVLCARKIFVVCSMGVSSSRKRMSMLRSARSRAGRGRLWCTASVGI